MNQSTVGARRSVRRFLDFRRSLAPPHKPVVCERKEPPLRKFVRGEPHGRSNKPDAYGAVIVFNRYLGLVTKGTLLDPTFWLGWKLFLGLLFRLIYKRSW